MAVYLLLHMQAAPEGEPGQRPGEACAGQKLLSSQAAGLPHKSHLLDDIRIQC